MQFKETILFVGGDKRQRYTVESLSPHFKQVYTYGMEDSRETNLQEVLSKSDIVVLPMPVAKEGNKLNLQGKNLFLEDFFSLDLQGKKLFLGSANREVKTITQEKGIVFTDYYNSSLAFLNAVPTAEGALAILIDKREETLFGSTVLMTGFGRVSKILAHRLKALGAKVTIAARKNEQLCEAQAMGYDTCTILSLKNHRDYDIVINTPNAPLFLKEQVEKFQKETLFLELASLPGGFQFDYSSFHNIIYAPSLPGKVAPKTAGNYIAQTILSLINEGEQQ